MNVLLISIIYTQRLPGNQNTKRAFLQSLTANILLEHGGVINYDTSLPAVWRPACTNKPRIPT